MTNTSCDNFSLPQVPVQDSFFYAFHPQNFITKNSFMLQWIVVDIRNYYDKVILCVTYSDDIFNTIELVIGLTNAAGLS